MINQEGKILVVISNFYPEISENLLKGCEKVLGESPFIMHYEKVFVDGSLEIPLILEFFKDKYKGFIVLGCVIKGETDHYHIVKDITFKHIYGFAYKNKLPLSSALLTVENYEQARQRSTGTKNLGSKAARVCINLIKLMQNEKKPNK